MKRSTSNRTASYYRHSLRVAAALALVATMLIAACGGHSSASKDKPTIEQQAWNQIENGAIVLDVRTTAEYKAGHLDGALNIPHDQLRARIAELGSDKTQDVVVYCRTGRRSGLIMPVLKEYGFDNVLNARSYQKLMNTKPQSHSAGE